MKLATLSSLKTVGVFSLVQNSRWRRERLLIVAYHGISQEDEHQWNPELFMPLHSFRSRMETIKNLGYTVLPLSESLQRLYANDLPERCLALTFDDGMYDFYKLAYPVIKEFNFPVTLYLTTYYSYFNRPVFDAICPYLIWKGRNKTLHLKEITGQDMKFDLSIEAARAQANDEIFDFARRAKLTASEKDVLACTLAKHLSIDYEALLAKRILHLLNPQEVSGLADDGVDIQLHTHRHRTPLEYQSFCHEIEDNRTCIQSMTGNQATHLCYPSGIYNPAFFPWLKAMGVVSATTCDPGLASKKTNRMLLPRFVDTSLQEPIIFEGWLTGVSASLPRRHKLAPPPKNTWDFSS
ncbi:MAG: polysaccharide deacetylase family protein [Blastocatellia bacterium]|nr:polysaccharide deacetylase family protein [Blastocatellia bacterium]